MKKTIKLALLLASTVLSLTIPACGGGGGGGSESNGATTEGDNTPPPADTSLSLIPSPFNDVLLHSADPINFYFQIVCDKSGSFAPGSSSNRIIIKDGNSTKRLDTTFTGGSWTQTARSNDSLYLSLTFHVATGTVTIPNLTLRLTPSSVKDLQPESLQGAQAAGASANVTQASATYTQHGASVSETYTPKTLGGELFVIEYKYPSIR